MVVSQIVCEFSILGEDGIQFDLRIFFNWVAQPPTRIKNGLNKAKPCDIGGGIRVGTRELGTRDDVFSY